MLYRSHFNSMNVADTHSLFMTDTIDLEAKKYIDRPEEGSQLKIRSSAVGASPLPVVLGITDRIFCEK